MEVLQKLALACAVGLGSLVWMWILLAFPAWVFGWCLSTLPAPVARLIGRYGLRTAARMSMRATLVALRGDGTWQSKTVPLGAWGNVLLACALSTVAAAFALYWVWFPFSGEMNNDVQLDVASILLIAYVGFVLSPFGLLLGFARLARPHTPYWWYAPLPDAGAWRDPVSALAAARDLYKLRLHWQLGLIASFLIFVAVWAPVGNDVDVDEVGYFLAGMFAIPTALVLIWEAVLVRACRLNGLRRIADVLRPPSPGRTPRRADAGARRRGELQAIIAALERYARRLDRAGRGSQHPTAKLLTLAAAHLRTYLTEHASVLASVPADVEDTLRRTAVVLSGTTNIAFLQETEACLTARAAAHEATVRTSRRGALVSAALDVAERTAGVAIRVVAAGLVLWLLLSQQMAAADLLSRLP